MARRIGRRGRAGARDEARPRVGVRFTYGRTTLVCDGNQDHLEDE
ncbi:hypothetical protein FRUB_01599 [Fimbriiglobus ruber]|uniref:Uncharacterized protein n=1 Tax=Fimbriiglobus ruber TaxID=1908690 RepID=A0A225E394_9BACT|nr:hypothetical protein FRUB_01599 [Fimbriiglobus ruber]